MPGPDDAVGGNRPDEAFIRAVRRLARPLLKAMIARGLTLPALIALLKQGYVEVAVESFGLDGRPMTDSRVSALTGVHRKDVRALRERGVPATARPPMSVSATVVGRWLGDPAYAGSGGGSRRLPRSAPADRPSFGRLVHEVSTDVRPRTILDELERQGLVAFDPAADEVTLLAEAYVPRSDHPAIYDFFASNLHDHLAAATENLLSAGGKAPFLERAVYYSGLDGASVARLEEQARALALDALARLNGEALALQAQDRDRGGRPERFRFGVYFYREPADGDGASDSAGEREP